MATTAKKTPAKKTSATNAAVNKATAPEVVRASEKTRSYMSQEDIPAFSVEEALVIAKVIFAEYGGGPDGHSKCSTYGQSNCSTPATVN